MVSSNLNLHFDVANVDDARTIQQKVDELVAKYCDCLEAQGQLDNAHHDFHVVLKRYERGEVTDLCVADVGTNYRRHKADAEYFKRMYGAYVQDVEF